MNELALFAGAGGGLLGSRLLGWRTVCAVEIEPYCREVLLRRQRDGVLDLFPIWDDVRTFDGRPWRGKVDIVTAGFPCQPFAVCGKHAGDEDERNLWPQTARVLSEVRPSFALLENSPALVVHKYFGNILRDISEIGMDARWKVVSAESQGAPIQRKRLFVVASANTFYGTKRVGFVENGSGEIWQGKDGERNEVWLQAPAGDIGVVDGMGSYVDRVAAIGNGQVPAVVRAAWRILT